MADGNTTPESEPGGMLLPLLRNWASLFPSWLTSSPPSVDLEQGIELDERSSNYENSPPIEEPCDSLSESSCSEEGHCVLQLTKNKIRHLLTEHMRTLGGRVQLLEDLEGGKINASTLKRDVAAYKPQEISALLLYASFLGYENLIPMLLECRAELKHSETYHGLTALHLCAFNGCNPFHHITDRGVSAFLAKLLNKGCPLDLRMKNGNTALHLAAEAGCSGNLALLIDNCANVEWRNRKGRTALHLAACSYSLECVKILLTKGDANINAEDNEKRTPLYLTLNTSSRARNVMAFLLERQANVNEADIYGYTPIHVATLMGLSSCVDLLIKHGTDISAETKDGPIMSIILRNTPNPLLNNFKKQLNDSVTLQQHILAAGEVKISLDFRPFLQYQQREIGYLRTFVKEGFKEILEHPLCQSFIHLKWQKIRKYYVSRLVLYIIYVIVLTVWVTTALAHNCYNESHRLMDDATEKTRCGNENSMGPTGFLYGHPEVMDGVRYALFVLTFLDLARKCFETYQSSRQLFSIQVDNMIEWCVITSVVASWLIWRYRIYVWQSQVGAFAVLCGWINVMLIIGQFPMFGVYVTMFTRVLAKVLKLLSGYACLFFGFTASFYMIFPNSKAFRRLDTGLVKVLVMMIGGLDVDDLFFFPDDKSSQSIDPSVTTLIFSQVLTELLFVSFAFVVTVVLMNLLIGIAINDIKELQKTAGLAILVRRIEIINDIELAQIRKKFPWGMLNKEKWTIRVFPFPTDSKHTEETKVIVESLNSKENILPKDILTAVHKIAREKKIVNEEEKHINSETRSRSCRRLARKSRN